MSTALPLTCCLRITQDIYTSCQEPFGQASRTLRNNEGTAQYLRYCFNKPYCCYQSCLLFLRYRYVHVLSTKALL